MTTGTEPTLPTDSRAVCSRFRKKPLEVDAWQYAGADDLEDSPLWLREYICEAWDTERGMKIKQRVRVDLSFWDCSSFLRIPTLEGVVAATKGDWVIRGVKGELYPCKPDIFEATYEPA
jgi:hypothetical protein